MVTSYETEKEKALQCYEEFLSIAGRAGFSNKDTLMRTLAMRAEKIREDRFCLLVAGEAKSGKSTFINAYLGTEILPMDGLQCTSSIIEISYGEVFVLKAVYADGRQEKITGEDRIRGFLKEYAALDDRYRAVPTAFIDSEIILKYKDKAVPEHIIADLLESVETENTYYLPQKEYHNRIREYIRQKQPQWKNMIEKISIKYPMEDKNMRGIKIVDSPGVNAVGRLGDITEDYIRTVDAVMFLRPVTDDPTNKAFRNFLKSSREDLNHKMVFLILTKAALEQDPDIKLNEYVKMYASSDSGAHRRIDRKQILLADSKAKLYFNRFQKMSTRDIQTEMESEGNKEDFLLLDWYKAQEDKKRFLEKLKERSHFQKINHVLAEFGYRAKFTALSDFLERVLAAYEKVIQQLNDNIDNYRLKAEDPKKFSKRITQVRAELTEIENKMNEEADTVLKRYGGISDKAKIVQSANEVMRAYKEGIARISENRSRDLRTDSKEKDSKEKDGREEDSKKKEKKKEKEEREKKEKEKKKQRTGEAIKELENLSFQQIRKLADFETQLQKSVVDECNWALTRLSKEKDVRFVTLKPDFSKEAVEQMKKEMKEEAEVQEPQYGASHKKVGMRPVVSQDKYFELVRNSIVERMDAIKWRAVRELREFVRYTVSEYVKELNRNADIKRAELEKVEKDKARADEIAGILKQLKAVAGDAQRLAEKVKELRGGIDQYA